MKRILLLFVALMLWITPALAAHTDVTAANTTISPVEDVPGEVKYYYTATNATTNATWYHLIAPYTKGHIKEIRITSDSTSLAAYLQEKVEVAATSVYTIISMTGISGDYSPELCAPRTFTNQDTSRTASLYFYIVPAVATGVWTLSITYTK